MDGAKEVERNRAARAVSAKVHTRARRRVSFGGPAETMGSEECGDLATHFRTSRGTGRFEAGVVKP
jgi:hypothetical protein